MEILRDAKGMAQACPFAALEDKLSSEAKGLSLSKAKGLSLSKAKGLSWSKAKGLSWSEAKEMTLLVTLNEVKSLNSKLVRIRHWIYEQEY